MSELIEEELVLKEKVQKQKTKKKHIKSAIWFFVGVNLLLLIYLQPYIPLYFVMDPFRKFIYNFGTFGTSFWLAIPVACLSVLIAFLSYRKINFKKRFTFIFRGVYLIVNVLLFAILALLVTIQIVTKDDLFKLQKFDAITGTHQSTEEIKKGTFYSPYAKIIRTEEKQIEIEHGASDTLTFDVYWENNTDYLLVKRSKSGFQDSLLVRITEVNDESYTCYGKMGDYAQQYIVERERVNVTD